MEWKLQHERGQAAMSRKQFPRLVEKLEESEETMELKLQHKREQAAKNLQHEQEQVAMSGKQFQRLVEKLVEIEKRMELKLQHERASVEEPANASGLIIRHRSKASCRDPCETSCRMRKQNTEVTVVEGSMRM